MKWRNGNRFGKMGMENGEDEGRTTIVGLFMVSDLREISWWL